jgi:hypothetical protein
MQQQITELLAQQSITQSDYTHDQTMDYDHKRNAPATPTTMSNSPTKLSKKPATEIVPKNLLDSLTRSQKQQQQHRSPARSHSLTAINEMAQGISRHSPARKTFIPTTSYAKETTGGNKQ